MKKSDEAPDSANDEHDAAADEAETAPDSSNDTDDASDDDATSEAAQDDDDATSEAAQDDDDVDSSAGQQDEVEPVAAAEDKPVKHTRKKKTSKRKGAKRGSSGTASGARKAVDAQAASSRDARPAASRAKSGTSAPSAQPAGPSRGFLYVAVALLVGGGVGAGWLIRDRQAKQADGEDTTITAAPDGSGAPSGPCEDWRLKICEGAGDTSAACGQAKSAVDLLTPGACNKALADVPATLAKVKAARVDCDTLVSKLCADLGAESKECKLVTAKTPGFPAARCTDMLKNYDQVIGGLRKMQQGAPPGMPPGMGPGGPHGGPRGMRPMPGGTPPLGTGASPLPQAPPAAPAPAAPAPAAPPPAAPAPAH